MSYQSNWNTSSRFSSILAGSAGKPSPGFPGHFPTTRTVRGVILTVESNVAQHCIQHALGFLPIHQFAKKFVSYRLPIHGFAHKDFPCLNSACWMLRRWVESSDHGSYGIPDRATYEGLNVPSSRHERPTRPLWKAKALGWETRSTFCSRGQARQSACLP